MIVYDISGSDIDRLCGDDVKTIMVNYDNNGNNCQQRNSKDPQQL